MLRGRSIMNVKKIQWLLFIQVSNTSQRPTLTDVTVQNKIETILSSYSFRKLARVNLLHHD